MSWQELPEQLVLPQVQRGVDYGARRPVLAQRGERVLLVKPSVTFTCGIGCRTTDPAAFVLTMADGSDWGPTRANEIFTGRLSKAKLAAAAPQIAAWLGCAVDELPPIHRRKTYVWQPEARTS